MVQLTRHKPSICAFVQKTWQACGRLSSGAYFKVGLILLLTNQIFGWLGLALGWLLAACTKQQQWAIIGTVCYGLSWGMLGAGLLLCGSSGKAVSKIARQKWRAWRRFRHCWAALALILFLGSCTTVEMPNRPLAYIYPTLFQMSHLKQCRKRKTQPPEVAQILQKARLKNLIEQYGFIESDYAVVARGLTKHGYAEIDARSCKNCPLKWLAIWYDGAVLTINVRFDTPIPRDILLKDSVIISNHEFITRIPF